MKVRGKAVLALGMFDGVHAGHRELVRRAKELADAAGVSCVVWTFSNHPAALFGKNVRLLCTTEEREYLLRDCGADTVWMEPFTETLMHMAPEAFVDSLLDQWDVVGMVAGFNYTFGDRGAGDVDLLRKLGEEKGFPVTVLPPVSAGGETVSSTGIRKALENGELERASVMLGRTCSVSGNVRSEPSGVLRIVSGTEILLPKEGVYRAEILTEQGSFRVVCKTFPEEGFTECMAEQADGIPDGSDALVLFRSKLS